MTVVVQPEPTLDDGFWRSADRHLVRYSGAGGFTHEIIESASGSFVTTRTAAASWTSPRVR